MAKELVKNKVSMAKSKFGMAKDLAKELVKSTSDMGNHARE